MARYFRVHSASEALDAALDVSRKDGWVASDETSETQPRGVSACASIGDLIRYCRTYGLTPQPGDVVLRLDGTECDKDRDQWACRVEVQSYAVIGDAARLARLAESARLGGWEADPDRVDALLSRWS